MKAYEAIFWYMKVYQSVWMYIYEQLRRYMKVYDGI